MPKDDNIITPKTSSLMTRQQNGLLHDSLAYPPNMYLPTLIMVTVGPLSSHKE